jgi:hypothetical protein
MTGGYCLAAIGCAFGAIGLGGLGSILGVDGSDGTWMLWAAALLLCVAMVAFLVACEKGER